jgi:hypothetical protein
MLIDSKGEKENIWNKNTVKNEVKEDCFPATTYILYRKADNSIVDGLFHLQNNQIHIIVLHEKGN